MDQGGRGRAQVEQSPRNSFLKRGGESLAQRTQFKLCKKQRFDLPGPKTRFFSTRRPQNLHVVQSAQTRTRPLAIDMHVGGRANTRSRDPGRTKLYCQSKQARLFLVRAPGVATELRAVITARGSRYLQVRAAWPTAHGCDDVWVYCQKK